MQACAALRPRSNLVECLSGLVQPNLQAFLQIFMTERAAFFAEQSAGFKPVQQLLKHLTKPRLERRHKLGLASGETHKRAGAQWVGTDGVQSTLQLVVELLLVGHGVTGHVGQIRTGPWLRQGLVRGQTTG